MSASHIAKALAGHRTGHGYLCRCPIPMHGKGNGDRNPSLSIADGAKGLLVRCFAGCNARDILIELRRRGLLCDCAENRRQVRAVLQSAPEPDPEPDKRALELWRSAIPVQGTLAEHYLRTRGITIDIPPSLRFLQHLDYMPRISFPTLIAAVQRPDRRIIACQVTWLDPGGGGKAKVSTPRKTIGRLGSGAVRLGPSGDALGLAEGVETALSAMQIFGVPVWASLGGGRMHNVVILDGVRELRIFGENDDPGCEAADRAVRANPHRTVIVHYPAVGSKDWNDAVTAPRLAPPA